MNFKDLNNSPFLPDWISWKFCRSVLAGADGLATWVPSLMSTSQLAREDDEEEEEDGDDDDGDDGDDGDVDDDVDVDGDDNDGWPLQRQL